jgi:hypothetical protein
MVPHDRSRVFWEDGERVFRRSLRPDDSGSQRAVLIVIPAAEHPTRSCLDRLTHEYELRNELDESWAVRPLELVRDAGPTTLVLEDADGEPLDRLLGAPMEPGRFFRLTIGIAVALGKLHQRGLVHKDIKPANILVNGATDEVRLTGFGIATRLGRERQSPHPPETIAGTLAYMAPEQTGRMNRSIDSRSDLYALGVTFYQMLTGALPFTAADPMEWVHCHLAKQPLAPAERLSEIPAAISAIVMKLLAKGAEERYQTAAGLESDTTLLTLLLMALLRIKRPEQLKERDPAAFGRLLGLDRAPEVKTLRRRLGRLAAHHCAEQLGAELARLRVDRRGHLMGFLYIDGHVRAYHGHRAITSKAYVPRRHLAMPASTDYWINDRSGDPLLVITAEVDAALTKALPRLLHQVRDLVGERRVTIVFDRGGWSPRLFATMIKDGFDLLTYRKGRCRRINTQRFIARRAEIDGHSLDYLLHDQPVRLLKGKLRLRQVTRLCDDGHQTQVITSRWDLRDIEVAHRMFERWRQENFFKYMREEFLLDALVDYQIEPEEPTRTIPNPERRALDKAIRVARTDLAKLEREYGAAAADNAERHRPTMRGFKIAHRSLGKQLRTARARVAQLFEQRRDVPKRVEIRDLNEKAVVKLATERKHLTDIIKMVAYQAESDLLALLRPHYARADQEGRTLLHELFATAGDIGVTDRELQITLAPLSSPHRTRAAHALCDRLDQTAIIFPGSRLRVRFAVRPPPRIGLAFPGPLIERSTVAAVAAP